MSRKLIGHVGVDSGQLMITDPCYVDKFLNDNHDSVVKDINGNHRYAAKDNLPYSYGGACAASTSADHGASLNDGDAVAVSTGWGDGLYPVYAEIDESVNRVARVIIDFQI